MNVAQLIEKLQELDPETAVVMADEHDDPVEGGPYFQILQFFYATYESKLPDGTTHSWKELKLVHPGEEDEYDEDLKESGEVLKPCVYLWS